VCSLLEISIISFLPLQFFEEGYNSGENYRVIRVLIDFLSRTFLQWRFLKSRESGHMSYAKMV